MLVKIEGISTPVETDKLEVIHKGGADGTILRFGNEALKICYSGYMTEQKIEDLRNAVPENEETRLIVPRKIVNALDRNPKLNNEPATGYTTKLIDVSHNGILQMTTDNYLSEAYEIRRQVHNYFSKNNIAMIDTNPDNLLPEKALQNQRLYLIDHDRDVTPNSPYHQRSIVEASSDYERYNEKKVALLMYKVILKQLQVLEGINSNDISPTNSYIDDCVIKKFNGMPNFTLIKGELSGFKTIYEYAMDTKELIKSKRK